MFFSSIGCLLCFTVTAKASWNLIWSDEFDGKSVDLTKWTFDFGDGCQLSPDLCGWGNEELQWYTNKTENVFLKDGKMIIKAVQDHLGKFTSTRMKTEGLGDWDVAKIEVRAKFPRDTSVNPGIWMLPTNSIFGLWPTSGAMGLAVMRSDTKPSALYSGLVYGLLWNELDNVETVVPMSNPESFFRNFHIFTLEKLKDELVWYLDGQKFFQVKRSDLKPYFPYPFNERFHLILSLAVGGKSTVPPTELSVFPQLFEFDYVRVYSLIGQME